MTGTITTDGSIGEILASDIVSWTWTIAGPGFSAYTLSSSDPGAFIFDAGGNAGGLFATSEDLTLSTPSPGGPSLVV